MLPSKDTEWLNGYKNKTRIYAVYKKPTSDLKTQIAWKWEGGKTHSMQMGSKRKFEKIKQKQKIATGVAIPISDKIDLKTKKITRDKKDTT